MIRSQFLLYLSLTLVEVRIVHFLPTLRIEAANQLTRFVPLVAIAVGHKQLCQRSHTARDDCGEGQHHGFDMLIHGI